MLFSIGAFGTNEASSWYIQPKIGVNAARITHFFDKTEPRTGLVAAVDFEYRANDWFSFSAGPTYSEQGTRTETLGALSKITIRTDYLCVPMLANFYVTKGFALKFGLQPGFLLSSTYKEYVRAQRINLTSRLSDAGIPVKTFDLAFPIGAALVIENLVIEGRYNLGLTNPSDHFPEESRNEVFQITVGYKFRL